MTSSVFFHPAFYEAFGLTVVEAMTCGLPTFATCNGEPADIIQHGVSGFNIDPYHPAQSAALMVGFFDKCQKDTRYWYNISDAGKRHNVSSWCGQIVPLAS